MELNKAIHFQLTIEVEADQAFQLLYDKYKPEAIIELQYIAQLAFTTKDGTILKKDGEYILIGNVGLRALAQMDGKDAVLMWIESNTGPISELLTQYGKRNIDDQMYHGQFDYYMELPENNFFDLFAIIKQGKYSLVVGSGMFYEGELRLLWPTE